MTHLKHESSLPPNITDRQTADTEYEEFCNWMDTSADFIKEIVGEDSSISIKSLKESLKEMFIHELSERIVWGYPNPAFEEFCTYLDDTVDSRGRKVKSAQLDLFE